MANFSPGLADSLAAASRRWRLQRLANVAGWSLRVASALLLSMFLLVLLLPKISLFSPFLLGAVGLLLLLAAVVAWLAPVKENRLVREIDSRLRLADHTITATELRTSEGTGWLGLQYADTLERLRNLDWRTSWPIRWPRFSRISGGALVVLTALLIALSILYVAPHPIVTKPPALTEEKAAIEALFKDWEKAAEIMDDPELKQLMAELKPIRAQLPEMNEREMLTELSKLENRLEALKAAAAKESLESSSAEMAAALENVDGMGALAAALRRKDFEKAAELAEASAEKLSKPEAAVPKGAESATAQKEMSEAAEKLEKSGQTSEASAMREMKESAAKQDPKGMGAGMQKLAQGLGKESQRQAASSRLGLQLAQVGQAKSGLGKGKGNGEGKGEGEGEGMGRGISLLPKLSSQKGGKGAGSDSDPNRVKDPTQLEAGRTKENLTGAAGEGESETETESSETPGAEAPRSGRNAKFAQYEKLSQEAIADENLPLAYREAIRKYFESIRPGNEK